jgi:hypothetical protein
MSNPTDLYYDYARQVLDYLYTTKDLVMQFAAPVGELAFDVYSKTTNLGLHAYSDASFADAEDRKSTIGYLFKFAGGTVCHRSAGRNSSQPLQLKLSTSDSHTPQKKLRGLLASYSKPAT